MPDVARIPQPDADGAAAEEGEEYEDSEFGLEEHWSDWYGPHCLGQ